MTAPSPQDLFVHHVLFYTPARASEADKAKLLEGLHILRGIPSIQLSHIGTPAATHRDVIERTYTYSWLCFFASAQDEESYQTHPLHDEFRTTYAPYWEKVVIYDAIGPTYGSKPAQQVGDVEGR
ncbi:Dabb family protein [Hymenobacter sp. BT491]|uniref:Dabb family protein n=1 Tax=Hymenobacter sp. BT491 TaxID=2766779 RepID=UPI001653A785|nr:Dabb family protein [Hymenobacter sp. BT491]MBC6989606.1 Dabb family protein [Hymenobacter sp. BT491]